MPPQYSINSEMPNYYQNEAKLSSKNEPKFNGVYSRNNLTKTKDRAFLISLDKLKSIETHWIALDMKEHNRRGSDDAIYFDGSAVEHKKRNKKK